MARRLPGFAFETVAPPVADTLPRMDIAVFVGFAASGPPQTPVAIEDPAQFAEIFGNDLELAFDSELQQPVISNLGPTVRGFFRNGGLRCWVVRVLGAKAETNVFPMVTKLPTGHQPGLYAWRDGEFQPAVALARSPGSWADNLQVATELNGYAIGVVALNLGALQADLAVQRPDDIAVGDLLRFHFRKDGVLLLLRVIGVSSLASGSVRITGQNPLWAFEANSDDPILWSGAALSVPSGETPDAELLTFDLIARLGDSSAQRMKSLGFFPENPRFWAIMPTDTALYSRDTPSSDQFQADVVNPRFALAGEEKAAPAYYPIGMPYVVTDLPVQAAPQRSPLERDGLEKFSSALFLDPDLTDADVSDLMNEADFLRYISPEPRLLLGIHAALAVDEATLIAVPDATQRGWKQASTPAVVPPALSDPLPHPEWWHFGPCPLSPVPLAPRPDRAHFLSCDIRIIPSPVLSSSPSTPDGEYQLEWTAIADASFILQEALDPSWTDASPAYEGAHNHFSFAARPSGVYYYRVRAAIGQVTSEWSNGLAVAVTRTGEYEVNREEDYDPRALIDVHRVLLRMAAARGDFFVLLSLPQHYREAETLSYIPQLKRQISGIRPLSGMELRAYSYGALYHSWLIAQENQSNVTLPPDGAACGVMAARSIRRGVWIAPANEPLESVVALENGLAENRWLDLLNAQVNVSRQDPHGFLWMSADTLSEDPDLRPINVRRLLILLRRLALQRGANYVFEPNSDTFERVVKYSFESLLGDMFDRGAFAGSTQSSSFRVITGSPVNTPLTRDQGMFLVELQVAPSQPMAFLTVRLTQTTDRAVVTEVG